MKQQTKVADHGGLCVAKAIINNLCCSVLFSPRPVEAYRAMSLSNALFVDREGELQLQNCIQHVEKEVKEVILGLQEYLKQFSIPERYIRYVLMLEAVSYNADNWNRTSINISMAWSA